MWIWFAIAIGCAAMLGWAGGALMEKVRQVRRDQPDANALYEAVRASRLGARALAVLAGQEFRTPEELTQAVKDAEDVMELQDNPGWKAFRSRLEVRAQLQKNAGYDLAPEHFASARGLQQKGIVIGIEDALNQVVEIISDGQRAASG